LQALTSCVPRGGASDWYSDSNPDTHLPGLVSAGGTTDQPKPQASKAVHVPAPAAQPSTAGQCAPRQGPLTSSTACVLLLTL
jgi:hypothetical protein